MLLLLLPLAACLAIFWLVLKFSSGRIATQYGRLAQRFGLELSQPPVRMAGFVRPDPSLYGHYRGREVSFSAPGKGIKDTRQIETVLKLAIKDRRLGVRMAPGGLLGGLRKRDAGALSSWKSGDEAFDKAVEVRTNQPRTLEAVMTDERRARLVDILKKTKASLYIEDGTMAYVRLGLIADEATRLAFEEVVEFLCGFAEAVEG